MLFAAKDTCLRLALLTQASAAPWLPAVRMCYLPPSSSGYLSRPKPTASQHERHTLSVTVLIGGDFVHSKCVDSALMTHVPVTPPHASHRQKDWAVLASSHMQPDMVISLSASTSRRTLSIAGCSPQRTRPPTLAIVHPFEVADYVFVCVCHCVLYASPRNVADAIH